MTLGLLLTSVALGFRHGVDWDHLAAIADLSVSAGSRRRGLVLSLIYALGHAVVVFALGLAAIAFGSNLPAGMDVWMGRVVGVTLIVLGVWTVYDLIARRRDFRLRSRWMLVLDGTFAGMRRVRSATTRRRVTVDHEHAHDHASDHRHPLAHDHVQAHDHAHLAERAPRTHAVRAGNGHPPESAAPPAPHGHLHHHELHVVENPTTQVGNGAAAAVGFLHGVGFESPTQIAIFVASSAVVGTGTGVVLLCGWIVGLLLANSAIALLAGHGLLQAERSFFVYATVAVTVGFVSTGTGLLLVSGSEALPALLT